MALSTGFYFHFGVMPCIGDRHDSTMTGMLPFKL